MSDIETMPKPCTYFMYALIFDILSNKDSPKEYLAANRRRRRRNVRRRNLDTLLMMRALFRRDDSLDDGLSHKDLSTLTRFWPTH